MSRKAIEYIYDMKCQIPSDIYQHLPTLKYYASLCDSVVELGVRSICSTWGLIAGLLSDTDKIKWMISYDLFTCDNIQVVYEVSSNTNVHFQFIEADDLAIEIPECDLLFIDTKHTRAQLEAELALHADKAKKYIILHDTSAYEYLDEGNNTPSGATGLWPALSDFLDSNKHWHIKQRFVNCCGLTILERG